MDLAAEIWLIYQDFFLKQVHFIYINLNHFIDRTPSMPYNVYINQMSYDAVSVSKLLILAITEFDFSHD